MIENLTEAQEAQLDVYKDKWLKIGLSTEEIDVEKSLEALGRAYAAADLVAPTKYEVYDSPFEAITEMKLRYDLDITPSDFVYGSQDAPWLSFYDFFLKECDVEECRELEGLIDFAKYSGWALLFDELIVLTKKPTHIRIDENNENVHNEKDFVIEYADGKGVAVWNNVTVPEEWIFDKSSITPEVMFKWPNIEQRRCACEIVGWVNVLSELNAKTIDEDSDPIVGTLLEVELPDSGTEKFLVVLNPNDNKTLGIPVPPEMKTALEANSWSYGMDAFNFKPAFRV